MGQKDSELPSYVGEMRLDSCLFPSLFISVKIPFVASRESLARLYTAYPPTRRTNAIVFT